MAKSSKQTKRKAAASKTRTPQAKVGARRASTGARGKRKPAKARSAAKPKPKKPAPRPQAGARGKSGGRSAAPRKTSVTQTKTTSKAKTKAMTKATTKATTTRKAGAAKAAGSKTVKLAKPGAGSEPSVADRARKAVARNAKRVAPASAAARAEATPADSGKQGRVRTKSPYNRRSLAPLRTQLLTMRTRLVGDIDLMGREALRADDADVNSENVADHGSDAFERHMTLELMENEARTLRQINQALDLMDGGTYGLCGVCNDAIPLARLQALPFAENCVACQTAQERQY
jgi:RNA polymerase-binding transcription factor DksA